MAFCSNCGKPLDSGAVCGACGNSSAPDSIDAMATELRRQRKEMRYVVIGLGVLCVIVVAAIANLSLHHLQKPQPVAPASQALSLPQSAAVPGSSSIPQPAPITESTRNSAPVQPQLSRHMADNSSEDRTGSTRIDPQEVQNALNSLTQRSGRSAPMPSAPAAPSGSDRYPGSVPVDVKDAAVPDIGIPVASQVYATSDSVSAVMDYYKQLYPDAQVMEISGQNIIAIDRPDATKVIAVGRSESGTTIAIVQPKN